MDDSNFLYIAITILLTSFTILIWWVSKKNNVPLKGSILMFAGCVTLFLIIGVVISGLYNSKYDAAEEFLDCGYDGVCKNKEICKDLFSQNYFSNCLITEPNVFAKDFSSDWYK